MEAIIGAIYLDGGFEITKECILRWYHPLLQALSYAANHKDPKTKLQEHLQSLHLTLPTYEVVSITGESHQQNFVIRCTVSSLGIEAVGNGTSRRRAEQDAATAIWEMIKK